MKKTHSFVKRITSLFLSLVFVLTSFATVNISSLVALADEGEYFLMAYFTGNLQVEQQIKFAVSTDGSNFKPLYGGNAVLQEKSTDTNNFDGYKYTDGVRDPYIFDGHDGYYYCIATDLEATAYGFWGNQSQMVLWRSKDLINWSNAYYINVAQICNAKRGTSYTNSDFQRTWAPEVFYENGQYMIYFALAGGDYQATRMHYMITDDLFDWTHYSAPQVLYDPGYDDIDADIIKENDTYYMFYKDETPGRSTVCLATASAMTGPYTYIGQFDTSSATGGIEGCEVYTVGSNYYLVADRFGAAGNFAIYNMGSSLAAVAGAVNDGHISVTSSPISTVEELYGFTNLTPRHGSIMHINESQYNALVAASGGVTDDDIMYNFSKTYSRTADGWAYENGYADSSLHNLDFMFKESGSSVKIAHDSGYATLKNATIFCNDETIRAMLPDDIYTVSFDYSLESTTNLSAPIFALGTGSGAPSVNTDYVMIFGNGDMWVRKSGESSDTFVANKALKLGVTYHYDVVSDGTNIKFYRDGDLVGSIAATVDFPTSGTRYAAFGFTDGHSSAGYGYGSYSRIRFRDRAVSSTEIKDESNALLYRKDDGIETINNKDNALDVSHSGNHNTADSISSRAAASYSIAGWVNPGESVDYNSVMIAIGNGSWAPGPYGRYFAVREDGTILFNYCSGSNDGGNWSQHYDEVNGAFSLSADTWAYIQVNIVPISDNQVKVVVFKDGVQTKTQDISLTTKVDDNDTDGNDYAYGMLGMLQLTTNNIYLGRLEVPSWWQNENGTTYVKDVRFYAQAMDPDNLYREVLINRDAATARDYVRSNLENYNVETETNKINTGSTKRKAYHYESECEGGYSNVLAQKTPSSADASNSTAGSTAFAGNSKVGDNTYNLFWPTEIALIYDGAHKTAMPVVLEINGSKNMTTLGINQDSGKSPDWKFDHYWTGPSSNPSWHDNIWREWPGSTYAYTTSFTGDYPTTDNGGSTSVTDSNAHIGYHWGAEYDWSFTPTNGTRFFWNQTNYVGTGNTSTYYDYYDTMYARAWQNSERTIPNCTHYTYVVNYKPVFDILKASGATAVPNYPGNKSLKTVYSEIKDNESAYTTDSLNQFYVAAYKVLTSNPVEYSEAEYRADFTGTVKLAANEIKGAVTEFNKINLVANASFESFDSTYATAEDIVNNNSADYTAASIEALQAALDDAEYYNNCDAETRANMSSDDYQTDIDAKEAAITAAKNALVAKIVITYDGYSGEDVVVKFDPNTSAADVEAAAPALTAAHWGEQNSHYRYEWDKAFAAATANTTYTETQVEIPHDWSYTYFDNQDGGRHTKYCNVPAFGHSILENCSYKSEHTEADGNTNGYTTYTCQYCGHQYVEYDTQDFTDYATAYADYEATIGAENYEAHYTAASRTAYEAAVAEAAIDTTDETLSSTVIANAAAEITAAKDELVVQTYTIRFRPDGVYSLSTEVVLPYGTTAEEVATYAPANTNPKFANQYQHRVYTWPEFATVTANAYYNEQDTKVSHTITDEYHAADGETNGYTTHTCYICGGSQTPTYDERDRSAYTAAVEEYNSIIGAGDYDDVYTYASRTAYETAVNAIIDSVNIYDQTKSTLYYQNRAADIIAAQDELKEIGPENAYNLTLENDIDVNFYLDNAYYAEQNATTVEISYITTVNDKDATRDTEIYNVSALEQAGNGAYSKVTMNAAPAQIAEPYVITVKSGDTVVDTITTSIQQYCQDIMAAELSEQITQADKDVAKALLNYGALADEYFGYAAVSKDVTGEDYEVAHTDDYKDPVDTDYIRYVDGIADSDHKRAVSKFTPGTDASGANITITSISYVALLDPEFRFYVSQENEVYAALTEVEVLEGDGLTAKMVKVDGKGNCVRVTGLKASDFGKTFKIQIGTATLTYNGYAYLYTVLRDESTATELKNLAKGVYRYADACETKFPE